MTIELDEYDAMLKSIADDVIAAHRDKPVEDTVNLLEQRISILTDAARTAILKVAAHLDTDIFRSCDLNQDEVLAWKLVVAKVRAKGVL